MKNPRDGRFKSLAEGPPELLLRLLGLWEPGMDTQPIDLPRELQLDAVQIDHAYRIGDEILHFEAISRWDARRVGTLALYRFRCGASTSRAACAASSS